MALKLELVERTNFAGGLNLLSDAFHVADDETADCLNVTFDVRGAVKKRNGYTVFNGAGTSIDFILPFTHTDGTTELVLAPSGANSIATLNDSGTTWTAHGTAQTAGQVHSGVVIKGAAYVINGTDQTAKWDGTTLTRLGTTLDATGNMPKAKYITVHKNRVFLGNTDTGSNQSRIRYSGSDTNPTDVEYYKSTSFIDVQPDDGDVIQQIQPFLDSLVIFKKASIWTLRGNNPRDFQLVLGNPSLGCVAPRSVTTWDKGVIFLSDRGVFTFDGGKVTRMSEKIDPALNALPAATLSKANGVVFQQKYYLFVNELGTDSVPDTAYVFDFVTGTWTKFRGWYSTHAITWNRVGKEELFAANAFSGFTSQVLHLLNGNNDGGGNINSYFTTKWMDFGIPERRKFHRRMYVWFISGGDFNVDVKVQRNYAAENSITNIVNLTPGGMTWGSSLWGSPTVWGTGIDIVRKKLNGLGTSPAIRVRIEDNSQNPAWTFEGLAFVIQPRNLA